jgi:hypothetical protein
MAGDFSSAQTQSRYIEHDPISLSTTDLRSSTKEARLLMVTNIQNGNSNISFTFPSHREINKLSNLRISIDVSTLMTKRHRTDRHPDHKEFIFYLTPRIESVKSAPLQKGFARIAFGVSAWPSNSNTRYDLKRMK